MERILLSIPAHLAAKMRALIPVRQRSSVIVHLIEDEIHKRERLLYECARAVEEDEALNKEMADWDVTIADGNDDESW